MGEIYVTSLNIPSLTCHELYLRDPLLGMTLLPLSKFGLAVWYFSSRLTSVASCLAWKCKAFFQFFFGLVK